ncbi:hypothetical protein [Kitasatospora sp. NPDC088548]|uniref:hypothetical protein n=1 Tax=Kitasatospora sp. NPDC088548 TaxID=3364075 RepID=UPI00381A1418
MTTSASPASVTPSVTPAVTPVATDATDAVFEGYEDVTSALASPDLVPPRAVPGPPGGVAWLRATVARFSTGEVHAARRALVEADLAGLDPAALRLAAAAGFEQDARLRAVRVLAQSLGLAEPEAVARAVAVVARAYFVELPDDAEADAAVAWLLPRMDPAGATESAACAPDDLAPNPLASGPLASERAANRIGLLVQACDATALLVEHARRTAARGVLPAALLTETLRHDPPVREMRRVAARDTTVAGVELPAGTRVVLDIAAAQSTAQSTARRTTGNADLPPLSFGAPPRVCPGRAHALALAAGILHGASDPAGPFADDTPTTSGHVPAEVVPAMVDHVLALAATWTDWDGQPVAVDGRTCTPHKAIRRVADHLIDHLAELEARLAGEPTQPDHWHASAATTPSDLAPFTPADLDEARSRLTRLARIWSNRLATLTPDQLDHSPGTGWTFRQLAFHVAESAYYADAIGALAPRAATTAGPAALAATTATTATVNANTVGSEAS